VMSVMSVMSGISSSVPRKRPNRETNHFSTVIVCTKGS
jgi:hypothetical protein